MMNQLVLGVFQFLLGADDDQRQFDICGELFLKKLAQFFDDIEIEFFDLESFKLLCFLCKLP